MNFKFYKFNKYTNFQYFHFKFDLKKLNLENIYLSKNNIILFFINL